MSDAVMSDAVINDAVISDAVISDAVINDAEQLRLEGRVLLVSSSGGHLLQLLCLRPWWSQYERMWVTFPTQDSRSLLGDENVVDAYYPTTRNVGNAARNLFLAFRVMRSFRPDLVMSTGAAVAFPFFVAAKLLGANTAYLEVYDRIDLATLTGRLCHPLSDAFMLQWDEQRRFYPRGRLIGTVL